MLSARTWAELDLGPLGALDELLPETKRLTRGGSPSPPPTSRARARKRSGSNEAEKSSGCKTRTCDPAVNSRRDGPKLVRKTGTCPKAAPWAAGVPRCCTSFRRVERGARALHPRGDPSQAPAALLTRSHRPPEGGERGQAGCGSDRLLASNSPTGALVYSREALTHVRRGCSRRQRDTEKHQGGAIRMVNGVFGSRLVPFSAAVAVLASTCGAAPPPPQASGSVCAAVPIERPTESLGERPAETKELHCPDTGKACFTERGLAGRWQCGAARGSEVKILPNGNLEGHNGLGQDNEGCMSCDGSFEAVGTKGTKAVWVQGRFQVNGNSAEMRASWCTHRDLATCRANPEGGGELIACDRQLAK